MPENYTRLLADLSRADIEKLLAAKSEVEALETRRAELQKELAAVDKQIERLIGKAVGKKVTRRPAKKAAKKVTKKAAKKVTKKVKKKAAKKSRKASAKPKVKLEDVVYTILEKNGGPMSFKDIFATIVEGKLYKSRSDKFDNVLRRTLSTSEKIKRISRGIYGI